MFKLCKKDNEQRVADFYNHWSILNKRGKMRFERQKYFGQTRKTRLPHVVILHSNRDSNAKGMLAGIPSDEKNFLSDVKKILSDEKVILSDETATRPTAFLTALGTTSCMGLF